MESSGECSILKTFFFFISHKYFITFYIFRRFPPLFLPLLSIRPALRLSTYFIPHAFHLPVMSCRLGSVSSLCNNCHFVAICYNLLLRIEAQKWGNKARLPDSQPASQSTTSSTQVLGMRHSPRVQQNAQKVAII